MSTSPVSAAITADDAKVDQPVHWEEGDGTPRSGVIVDVSGLESDAPTVTVAPDEDPESVIELPIEILYLPEDADSEDEEDVPDDEAAEGEVEDEADEPAPDDEAAEGEATWEIVADHPDCTGDEGTVAVVAVDADGAEVSVDSCHPDEASAQARVDELLAGSESDDTEVDLMEMFEVAEAEPAEAAASVIGSAVVEVEVSGMSELERAAELASQIRGTLDLMRSLASLDTAADVVVASDETDEVVEAEPVVEETDEVVADEVVSEDEDVALSDATEEDLVAELARRFADDAADRIEQIVTDLSAAPEDASTDESVELVADDAVEVAVEEDAPEDDAVEAVSDYEWEGVLTVEGMPSGDRRMVAEGALTWRELPVPLMLQTVNASGHDGAIICGSIQMIDREGQNILGAGRFDSGAAGQEALRLLTEGTMRGVSVDIDSVVVEWVTDDGVEVPFEEIMFGGVEAMEVLVEGRIMGATLCPFPAFQEAHVKVISSNEPDEAMVASGAEFSGDVWRVPSPIGVWVAGEKPVAEAASAAMASLVASAAAADIVEVPARPPKAWFAVGEMDEPVPFTIFPDGRCYGLVAQFGSCHIGFTDRCVDVPRSRSGYRHFHNKAVLTEEGELVKTGPIFMDTVHPSLRLKASDAQAHYADTGCAFADVALYENEFGVVAAGALRPGLTEKQVRTARGSDVSPDWRTIRGSLEVVGLLSVNVSGFVVQGLVASGSAPLEPMAMGRYDSVAGEVTALVAAGMVHHSVPAPRDGVERLAVLDELAQDVAEMRDALEEFVLAPARARRVAEMRAALGLSDPEESRKDKAAALLAALGVASDEDMSEVADAVAEFAVCECGGECGCSEDVSEASPEV